MWRYSKKASSGYDVNLRKYVKFSYENIETILIAPMGNNNL